MKTLYMLIGVPGSGKSTWLKNQPWMKDCTVISSDDLIEAYAESQGKTYNEVFDEYAKTAMKLMNDNAVDAIANNKNIIWDQTNVSVKSRTSKLKMFKDYYKVAVAFKVPDDAELKKRLASRPGKPIPDFVMKNMIASYAIPTYDEDFDEIWYT
jgi:predicted kinase